MTPLLSHAGIAPVLALLLNAFIWGISWWPLRQLHSMGIHPLWATAFIYALAAILIWLWRRQVLKQVAGTPLLWWVLIASGITNAAFNWAVSMGDVVRVVLLFYLMPLWSLLLARLLLSEPMTAGTGLRALLSVTGAACVVADPASSTGHTAAAHSMLADSLAVLSGFACALNAAMLRRGAALPGEDKAMAMFLGSVTVAGSSAALFSSELLGATAGVAWPSFSSEWVAPIFGLALVFLMSNLCLQYAVARLKASVTAVVMPCEVVFAAITAIWWGGATLHMGVAVGGMLILFSVLASVQNQSLRRD